MQKLTIQFQILQTTTLKWTNQHFKQWKALNQTPNLSFSKAHYVFLKPY